MPQEPCTLYTHAQSKEIHTLATSYFHNFHCKVIPVASQLMAIQPNISLFGSKATQNHFYCTYKIEIKLSTYLRNVLHIRYLLLVEHQWRLLFCRKTKPTKMYRGELNWIEKCRQCMKQTTKLTIDIHISPRLREWIGNLVTKERKIIKQNLTFYNHLNNLLSTKLAYLWIIQWIVGRYCQNYPEDKVRDVI